MRAAERAVHGVEVAHDDGRAPRAGSAAEISGVLAESRHLFASIGFFSAFVNLLMLTGPLFMLQVYNRELASRSEATLVALAVIAAFLFLIGASRPRAVPGAGPCRGTLPARLDKRVSGVATDATS